ncbi:uncharacterized protein LOC144155244 [Haemaphysalis longicornis]
MPNRRRNFCFAPGCRTGYSRVKDAPKASLFNVPRDEERRKQWERNLHRADKVLDETCAVCELHFEPRYVIKDYVHVINGSEVRIPRGKAKLSDDAVPTILPNLPAYLTKTTPKPRRKRRCSGRSEAAAGFEGAPHHLSFLFHLKTPSKYWSTHYFPDLDGVLYCTSVLEQDAVVTSEKVVMFVCDKPPDAHCKVYLRGRLLEHF